MFEFASLKMAKLLLVLIVDGRKFHKTGAAWAKAWFPSVEQLPFGAKRRDWEVDKRA